MELQMEHYHKNSHWCAHVSVGPTRVSTNSVGSREHYREAVLVPTPVYLSVGWDCKPALNYPSPSLHDLEISTPLISSLHIDHFFSLLSSSLTHLLLSSTSGGGRRRWRRGQQAWLRVAGRRDRQAAALVGIQSRAGPIPAVGAAGRGAGAGLQARRAGTSAWEPLAGGTGRRSP
jgi:hypothetical protein